eukprot:434908-Prymnesium_polylepis.1
MTSEWRPKPRPRVTLCDAIAACVRGDGFLHDGAVRSALHVKLARAEAENEAEEALHKYDSHSRLIVPLVKTSHLRVEQALALLAPTPDDVLVDLGCGDGRLVLYAAERTGAMSYGMD